jgi:CDP-diacylglycerol---glycerol-3-phosphate 3-phosphatidyltransferase
VKRLQSEQANEHDADGASLCPAPVDVVNLPNSITLSRILCIPLLIWVLSTSHLSSVHGEKELIASLLFALAAITDGFDGHLARKRNQITTMGILLDPLADKLLVASAFIVLVEYNPHIVKGWIAVIIIAREFIVSGLRSIAAGEGFSVQASDLGKLKMVAQVVACIATILDHRWWEADFSYGSFHFILAIDLIAKMSIWFMVAVSVISAVDYFVAFWSTIAKSADTRRQAVVLSRQHPDLPPQPARS